MGRYPSITGEDRAILVRMHSEGESALTIAKALNKDRRTVTAELRRLGYQIRMGKPAKGRAATQEAIVAMPRPEPVVADDRAGQARGRLWDVLMDTSSPGQAVVQAFNALAESEGWASAPPPPLPEPADGEVADRFLELFAALPEGTRHELRGRLTRAE